jgi:serine protease Do
MARSLRVVFVCCCVLSFGWSRPASAQDTEMLWREFDARLLSAEEKRLLQVGLTAAGLYDGLIDGEWGARSQAAIEAHVVANDLEDEDGLVHNYHMAMLGDVAMAFVAEHGLAYRGGGHYGHLLLAPWGDFAPDPTTDVDDLVLAAGGVEIRTMETGSDLAVALHEAFEADIAPGQAPYLVRRDTRWGTASSPRWSPRHRAPIGRSIAWWSALSPQARGQASRHPGAP